MIAPARYREPGIFLLLLFFVILSALCGCAGSSNAEKSSLKELPDASAEAPRDSLRAKFKMTLVGGDGKPQSFDAVLFSVPGKRYRMELTGPMGIGVASLLWTETGWQMVFPTEKLYVQGAGYMVGLLSDETIPVVHIHQMASIFEGILLPENFKDLGDGNAEEANGRKFSYSKNGSQVSWIKRMGRDGGSEMLRFEEFKTFDKTETPTHIVFERNGKMYLEIQVKTIKRGNPFSLGVWRLNIPKSYKRME